MPNSTQNSWRPRLHPRLAVEIRQIALRKNITDESALLGVMRAGIAAMNGIPVAPVLTPAPSSAAADASV